MHAEDAAIIGEGVIDGRAQESDWWIRPKEVRTACRGNLLYTQRCKGLLVQGLTFMNSPSWNLHPAFSSAWAARRFITGMPLPAPMGTGQVRPS